MSYRVAQRPRAIADVLGIVETIAQDSPSAAERFFLRYRRAVEGLTTLPARARRYRPAATGLGDIRVLAVPGFPNHLIFFRIDGDTIDIVRVLHGARDIVAVLEEPD